MTAIVHHRIKTKKQLKEALAAGDSLSLRDPTPWGETFINLNYELQSGEVAHFRDGRRLSPGYSIFCTNHPKRSWFAEIIIKPDNTLKVR